ncbi:hypothetical protein Hanom_Chr11g00969821 [Helianthus anomalus]
MVPVLTNPCTFEESRRLNALQSGSHRDHSCTFGKLGTKSKILFNHRDHPCTLLYININRFRQKYFRSVPMQ